MGGALLGLSAGESRCRFLKIVGFSAGSTSMRTYGQGIIGHPTLLQHCLKLGGEREIGLFGSGVSWRAAPCTSGPGHLGDSSRPSEQVSVPLEVNRRGQVDQGPGLQTDLGGWCCAHQGKAAGRHPGAANQRRRELQRNPVILLQLSCPWRVGAKGRGGRGGGEGHSTGFFGP